MRNITFSLTTFLVVCSAAVAAEKSGHGFDWSLWRSLPVQDGGRQKPLDTLAWETLRTLANRGNFTDPETGEKLSPTALYLTMLFQYQAGEQPAAHHGLAGMDAASLYFVGRAPDAWDRAPLLRLDYRPLREALDLPMNKKHFTPLEISKLRIEDPLTGKHRPFLAWARDRIRNQGQGLTEFEKKGAELASKLWAYQGHRMGTRLEVLPVAGSKNQEWISVARLLRSDFNDQTDPSGGMRKAKEAFHNAKAAYLDNRPEGFNRASAEFLAAVADVGPKLGPYPNQATIDLETSYNDWAPFRFAWVLSLLTSILMLFRMGTKWKPLYGLAIAAFLAAMAAMFVGFGLRCVISARAPVTNMYESVIYLGLGTAVIGLVFELIYRKEVILAAAAAVTTVALILADNCPAVLDPSFRPLQPVLRSNFWLVVHVMTITLSYAAFALALGIGNITLGHYLFHSSNREMIGSLSMFTYRSLQVGVLLLALGTVTGGIWADYSWGRFWGWDPKEVWALIALLAYLAVLHARYAGWVGQFGLAALSVLCFSLIVMAWYGVNFVLGAGLHSYGFGGGGNEFVYGALVLQFLYVAAAAARHTSEDND